MITKRIDAIMGNVIRDMGLEETFKGRKTLLYRQAGLGKLHMGGGKL